MKVNIALLSKRGFNTDFIVIIQKSKPNVPFDLDDFPGARGGKKKEIDNTKYYTLLNVTKESTTDEVKKSFRKIALKEHPDKGGDAEKVSEFSR